MRENDRRRRGEEKREELMLKSQVEGFSFDTHAYQV
jgi:hypothetical protein